MEVCETCGCFLIIGDVQQRIEEHFTGKQHLGFAKITSTMNELKVILFYLFKKKTYRSACELLMKQNEVRNVDGRKKLLDIVIEMIIIKIVITKGMHNLEKFGYKYT